MYRYETHLHTYPVSACAQFGVKENLEFYKKMGYAGVFITNHFLDGNINIDRTLPYEDRINFFFSDYEEALKLSNEIGIDVFCGVEMSYLGTDFLIYGLDKEWFLAHSEIEGMKRSDLLNLLTSSGALVVQAHPFRNPSYLDHIRLFPDQVHGLEIFNACNDDVSNELAGVFADKYSLYHFAGSDNHTAHKQKRLAGMEGKTKVSDEKHFVELVLSGKMRVFITQNEYV